MWTLNEKQGLNACHCPFFSFSTSPNYPLGFRLPFYFSIHYKINIKTSLCIYIINNPLIPKSFSDTILADTIGSPL